MSRESASLQIPGFQPVGASPPDLASLRARVSHDIAAGHCADCDGVLEVQARSAASALLPSMVGVAATRAVRAEDKVSISSAARAAALRGSEDASYQSRAADDLEKVLDVEALDPEFQHGRPNPLDLDAARAERLTRAVDDLAAVLDGEGSAADTERAVDRYLQALDPATRDDLAAFVRTLDRSTAPDAPGAPDEVIAATDEATAATDEATAATDEATDEAPAATDDATDDATDETPAGPETPEDMDAAELRLLEELKTRDRQVKAHEQAHKAAAGPHGGAVAYEYESGPDGRKYAVGGEVPVDLSPVRGDPEATLQKMRQLRRAALAPADPSSADRAVAARAAQLSQEAQAAIRDERREADAEAPRAPGESGEPGESREPGEPAAPANPYAATITTGAAFSFQSGTHDGLHVGAGASVDIVA